MTLADKLDCLARVAYLQMGGVDALSEALVAAHLPPVVVAQTSKDMELTGIVELVPQGSFKLVTEEN